MNLLTRKSSLLSSVCLLGLVGCGIDNEAAIKEQVAKAKGTIPGSRSAQAQTQEEYYEITPGLRGAGAQDGPRPDQGAGYPGVKSTPSASSSSRPAKSPPAQSTGSAGAKK